MVKFACRAGKSLIGDNRSAGWMRSSFLAACLIVLSFSVTALGQELAATLTGTVTDSSGAVVPGASVVVHSQETGADVRTVATTGSGNFNITNLPAGRYTVTVRNSGFETFVANEVVLNVAEKHALDVQLKTGKASETVEVTAENVQIQTTTAEESGTVTGEQVRDLALNNRNFEQLVLLQPGVSNQLGDEPGFGLSSNTVISINGAREGANNWTVDGADINDSGSNGTLLNTPSVDAIQEFTLERSNYDASFGRSGGGQIVVATKSGTKQFHGSAYEFNRNNYYNANTFENRQNIDQAVAAGTPFSQAYAANPVPIERYNDFGFTIGGPLFIPKLFEPQKDKTFFFWSEEWRKASTPGSTTITVPTTGELTGVFTAAQITGSNTTPVPVAPAGCVTTAGTGANQSWTINPSCYSQNAAAYLKTIMAPYPPNSGSNQLVESFSQLNNFRQDIVRLDQSVGDKVRVFARFMQDSVPENFPYGLWGTPNYPGADIISLNAPGRNIVANASMSISPKVVNEIEFADSWGAINAGLSGAGNLSVQHGNHTIRLGATAMWMTKTENATAGYATFNFSSAVNGDDPFANFLLGQADSYTQPNKDTVPHLDYTNFEAYVQDDWKLTRRLTLNLGVRYSYFPSPTDSNNTLVNFDPTRYNPADAPTIVTTPGAPNGNFAAGNAATYANGLIFPTGANCATAMTIAPLATCSPYGGRVNPSSNNNWGPRLGIAWDPRGNGKLAVRAGYGLFYDRSLNGIWEQNAFNDPPLVQTTSITNNGTSSLNLFDNYHAGTAAGAPLGPNALTTTGAGGVNQSPTFRVPSYQDYNVSVQSEILRNTVLEVGYVGTKGTHLLGDIDTNQPTVATREANPGVGVNAIAPYLGYGLITARDPVFTSNYNSLQISLNRRLTRGLMVGAAYTWSKLLTTNPLDRALLNYDTYDLKQSYGLSTLNTPQVFVLSYLYQLPFYRNQNSGLGWLLGGWELSGIVNFQSGQSQIVYQESDPWSLVTTATSTQACTISTTTTSCPLYPGGLGLPNGSGNQGLRADRVPGVSTSGPKTPGEYFNIAAFTDAVGHFGSAAPGAIQGPGFQRWDTSLFKKIQFGERASLQLRLETFNTFNHGSPNLITTDVDNSTFGQVSGYHIPRNVQIGAKLNF
jgi:outer membrane receptor protein involved in Fe transport